MSLRSSILYVLFLKYLVILLCVFIKSYVSTSLHLSDKMVIWNQYTTTCLERNTADERIYCILMYLMNSNNI